jgi:integrase
MNELAVTAVNALANPRARHILNTWLATARPATRRAYQADLESFIAYCGTVGASWLPALPQTVVAYLQAERAAGKAASTTKRRTAAIVKPHKFAQLGNPDDEEVRMVLKAIAEGTTAAGKPAGVQTQAAGLTQTIANKITGRLEESTDVRDSRDLAVVLIGRDLLARASELVSLTVECVSFDDDGTAVVCLERMKTAKGKTGSYPLGADAVTALRRWLKGAQITAEPIFRSLKNGKVADHAIGVRDVPRIVKRLAGEGYSSHSLRVGMAQDLREANFETAAIMQAGGWKTPQMVARYTEKLNAKKGAVAHYHARHK